jgi:hypothetical protein
MCTRVSPGALAVCVVRRGCVRSLSHLSLATATSLSRILLYPLSRTFDGCHFAMVAGKQITTAPGPMEAKLQVRDKLGMKELGSKEPSLTPTNTRRLYLCKRPSVGASPPGAELEACAVGVRVEFFRTFAGVEKRTAAAHRRRKKRRPRPLTLPESLNQNLQRQIRCSAPRLRARPWLERQASCPRPRAFCRYEARPTDSSNVTCVARRRSICIFSHVLAYIYLHTHTRVYTHTWATTCALSPCRTRRTDALRMDEGRVNGVGFFEREGRRAGSYASSEIKPKP